MSSIFGIVARSEPGKQNALLTHMLAAAPNSAGQTSDQQASAQAGLAATRRGAQGGIARSGTHWLAFAGHMIEDEDYQARLRLLTVVTPEGFCEQLLALYLCLGVEGLQSLNGQYAIAVWDERTQRMLLVNDRYGLQPFYYWRGPHELVFGSQMKAIAMHPAFKRQVDPLGLADLLATGQMMGEHTLYAGVKALPPATRLLFEAGYLAMEPYARLPFYAPGWADHEPKQAVEELDLQVQAALKRCLIPGARLLLSGGLDSRLLAGYLGESKNGSPFSASSVGMPRSRDVSLGREAAEEAGLPHHVVPVEPTYLRDYAPRCVERTEGNMNAVTAWIFSAEDDLAQHPAQALITGVGAEVITGQHILAEQNPQNEQDALNWLFNQRWAYNQASALLRPELRPAVAESQASLARILTESPEELLSSRLDDFHYRMIRRQPTGSLLSAVVDVREPYFDNDLVDFALRLPPQLRTRGQLFSDLLQLRFPALAEIPGAAIPPRPSSLQRAWRRMNRRLARAFNFFTGGPYGDDPALPVYYNHWMRSESRSYVSSLLANGDLLGDFCDMRAVRRLLADHMTGRSDSYRLLGALVTFAEWRKQFSW